MDGGQRQRQARKTLAMIKSGQPVYLDWNATTPLRTAAKQAVLRALDEVPNPSSVHSFGRSAKRVLEDSRRIIATAIGAAAADVIFTSGATEANALALQGHPWGRVLVSAVEHDSVLAQCPSAERIPVDPEGRVDLEALERMLAETSDTAPKKILVSIMAINNETGVLQPLQEASEIVRASGAFFHVDAAQALTKSPLAVEDLGATLMSFSAHKVGSPAGTGALYCHPSIALTALVPGGGQEKGRRAGTENLLGIQAFAAAVEEGMADQSWLDRITQLRDRIEHAAQAIGGNGLVIGGAGAQRLGTTTSLAIAGLSAETQVMRLDLEGIAVSAGSACSSGKVKRSHVLEAMGHPYPGDAIRVSLGWSTTEADVDRFIAAWTKMAAPRFVDNKA